MEAPKFTHDCDASLFLGTWLSPDGEIYDLYVCKAHSGEDSLTIMARFGNEGHEYLSDRFFLRETPSESYYASNSLPILIANMAVRYRILSGQLTFPTKPVAKVEFVPETENNSLSAAMEYIEGAGMLDEYTEWLAENWSK